MLKIDVFIENEADKASKNLYDEKALVWKQSVEVSGPYPLPYGFVIGTTGPDGDNVDCFVISGEFLSQGQRGLSADRADGADRRRRS